MDDRLEIERENAEHFGDIIKRVAKAIDHHAPHGFDPHSDDLTVQFAMQIADKDELIAELLAALRGALCPGGGYGGEQPRDEYRSVQACLSAGKCGCSLGAAVLKAEPAAGGSTPCPPA